jgi:hypothetical protein
VQATGDNLNSPITFGVDIAWPKNWSSLDWKLSLGSKTVDVPDQYFDGHQPYLRLLPSEIFGLLGAPVTSTSDRVVKVTAKNYTGTITTAVTFKGQSDATYTHAVPPSFNPVFRPSDDHSKVTFRYDLRGLRDANGGLADGGVLIVSDIDRILPRAFTDRDPDSHGFKKTLTGLTGTVTVSADELPNGVGAYGIALRGTKGGVEIAGSTSAWLPLRYAPQKQQIPTTPKIQAEASLWPSTAPLFYDIADIEANGGSSKFAVTFDVRNVDGARAALVEFSSPAVNFTSGLFFTGKITAANLPNRFTNPNGDRLDKGNRLGQPGSTTSVKINSTHGVATLDGAQIGLSVPTGVCDNTYQVRVFALDSRGKIVGVASNTSEFGYGDFSRAVCFG